MENMRLESLRAQLKDAQPFVGVDTFLGSTAGGHTQTLLGHFLPVHRIDLGEPERIDLEVSDGDRLIGFKYKPTGKAEIGLLHVFHGLAGSSESFYMPRAAHGALSLGFAVVLWNHRGCGPGRKLALEPYHSGRSDDLARAVRWGRDAIKDTAESYTHGVLGYSLSANAGCLLAAQVVPARDTKPLSAEEFDKIGSLPDFVIAVNPPFDLKRASERLSRGPSRIYGQSFMGALLESLDDRKNWNPENEKQRLMADLAAKARRRLNQFASVGVFDAAYTGPAGGFQDDLDYYERASSGRYIHLAKIPLVVLSADDDPITNGFRDLNRISPERFPFSHNSLIVIDDQTEGGHMGYVDRLTLLSPWKKEPRWLERRIKMYLRAFVMILFVIALGGCSLINAWQSGAGPSDVAQKGGMLNDCPVEPNCISTQATRADQMIVPFTYSKSAEAARQALKEEMARVPGAKLVKEDGFYLHFECRSRVLQLVDDVEFLFNEETKTLQFRSASRFGYSDWGANRKRMEEIRNKILGDI